MTEQCANQSSKKQWTDEERMELAAKLEEELVEHMNKLEKQPYTEGWPEDKWQGEMEKHPFFMKKCPEPDEELSPLMIGLQQLKYGEDENTPEELAANYKEDGNFNFKHKKYHVAILSYTEGIKTNCKDSSILAQLYNNRSAAHFMLKNYRSSYNDCKNAMKYQENYSKPLVRAASCCFYITKYNECIELCNKYLAEHGEHKEILTLLANANLERKKSERDARMAEKLDKLKEHKDNKLMEVLKLRKINFEAVNGKQTFELQDLTPQVPQLANHRVHLGPMDKLFWPVMILYPETKQSDFIQAFLEDAPIMDRIEELFAEPPAWDVDQRYTLSNINVYYEGGNKDSVHIVDISKTLGTILKQKKFVVRGGTPSFLILIASSDAEKNFLANYKMEKSS